MFVFDFGGSGNAAEVFRGATWRGEGGRVDSRVAVHCFLRRLASNDRRRAMAPCARGAGFCGGIVAVRPFRGRSTNEGVRGRIRSAPLIPGAVDEVKPLVRRQSRARRGGPRSGIDGGNDGGKGITDTPEGLKLQAEGHDVRYRNAWIKELDLKDPETDFRE